MKSASNAQATLGLIGASVPVSLVGSFPGTDVWETTAVVRGELPELPLLPELPARGPGADMIGRTMSLLSLVSSEFSVATTPTGWRFASVHTSDRPSVMRRASSWLGEDLDAAESSFAQYEGNFKLQLAGPWTLAACVELANGDRVLRDRGAVVELHAALAEAVRAHIADVARRLPLASFIVQFDEPMIDSVLEGSVKTPSGFSAYAPIAAPQASHSLRTLMEAARESGGWSGLHTCTSRPDVPFLAGTGANFVSCDVSKFGALVPDARGIQETAIGDLWDAGQVLFAGLPIDLRQRPGKPKSFAVVAELLHRLGISIDEVDRKLALTPACGLAGDGSLANVRAVIAQLQSVSSMLRGDRLDDLESARS